MITNEQEMTSNIQKVTYPDLSKYSLPQHYRVMAEIQTASEDKILLQRKQFLFTFYVASFASFSLSLIIYLLGLFDWWLQIVTIFSYRYSSDYYDTFEDFQRKHGQSKTLKEYTEWKLKEVHLSTDYRWTFFLFSGLLAINILIVAFGRAHQIIKYYQKRLLFSQAVLLGFTLLGLAGYSRDRYWQWRDQCLVYISILLGLAGNSLISIILIRFDQIKFYQGYKCQILLISGVMINLIIFLLEGELDGNILFGEIIALYGFYYYHQLNISLLKDPETLPKHQSICSLQSNNSHASQQTQRIEQDQIIMKSRQFVIFILITIFCCLILFQISAQNLVFKLIISMGIASIISLFFDSQIASTSLQESDSFLAASLTWIDLCCPLKNIIRSIFNNNEIDTEIEE